MIKGKLINVSRVAISSWKRKAVGWKRGEGKRICNQGIGMLYYLSIKQSGER